MNTKILLACCISSIPILGFAYSQDQACQSMTKHAIEQPRRDCTACAQAKQFDHYDYHAGLVAAHATQQGLQNFIDYTARSTVTGAAGEEQACHLYALLLKWGDTVFTCVLTTSGEKAKKSVIGLLDYAGVTNFKKRFPKTYGLVSVHEE